MHANNFNPRTPCGVRPSPRMQRTRRRTFQSTHPLRGATHLHRISKFPASISIHAPLAGCDPPWKWPKAVRPKFQSTHPLRGATVRPPFVWKGFPFQSTHPLRGATLMYAYRAKPRRISIHAPLAGCDICGKSPDSIVFPFQSTHPLRGATLALLYHRFLATYFNPRTPCGVRRVHLRLRNNRCGFQSTHPLRGATLSSCPVYYPLFLFQSTHPLRGATEAIYRYYRFYPNFNPRTPCGVRLEQFNIEWKDIAFQSTHPLRGATLYLVPIRGSHHQQRADSLKNKLSPFKTNK